MNQSLTANRNARRRTPFGLTTWIPRDVFDFERVFDSMFEGDSGMISEGFSTRLDLTETEQTLEVRVDLPGMAADEVEVNVENNVLTIRGERKEEKEERDEKRHYHRVERRFGSFARSVMLPCPVNDNEAVAEFKNGVLKVVLPKSESAKPKKIVVK